MIISAILTLIKVLIFFVFNLLPDLPNLPSEAQNVVSQYISLITNNLTFISFFIDVGYTKIILTTVILLFGFRESYKFIMWVYHKLPFSSE